MFKLFKGEIKKIFLKSGIFVVTALLVLVLTISALIFSPSVRENGLIEIEGETINELYDKSFGSISSSSLPSKLTIDKNISASQSIIDFYQNQINLETKKEELFNLISEAKKIYDEFYSKVMTTDEDGANDKKNELKNKFVELRNKANNYIEGENVNGETCFYVLISKSNKTQLQDFLKEITVKPFGSSFSNKDTINSLKDYKVFIKLNELVNNMVDFIPSQNSIDLAVSNLDLSKEKLEGINQEIENLKLEFGADNTKTNKNLFKKLYTKYTQCAENAKKLTKLTMLSSVINDIDDSKIQSFYELENEVSTKYDLNEELLKCQYYLDTNKYAFEYASPLSLSVTSNDKSNMYDFMYFSLELCSFIIIIYVVFVGATMLAGEYQTGTIKLLAIRPYSRRKILASKLFATIFIGLIFLLLSMIVTSITGLILFGANSLDVLLIFNSSTITSVNPFIILLLYFLCKMIEIIFYAIFAITISTLFKSNTGSVVIAIIIYFVSIVLTMFTSSLGIIKYFPFVNANLFKYFGSHKIGTNNSFISTLFEQAIANDMNFYISFASIIIFATILYMITSYVFRRRDIK